jgi:hypothetical protein
MDSEYTKLQEVEVKSHSSSPNLLICLQLVTILIQSVVAGVSINWIESNNSRECGENVRYFIVGAVCLLILDSSIIFMRILLATNYIHHVKISPDQNLDKMSSRLKIFTEVGFVGISVYGMYVNRFLNNCIGRNSNINEGIDILLMYFWTMSIFILAVFMKELFK